MNLVLIFGILVVLSTSYARGVRNEKEQFYVNGNFKEITKPKDLEGSEEPNSETKGMLVEKVKPTTSDLGVNLDATHETVDQESIGIEKKKKFINGRNYQTVNLTVEYVPGKENETWNVEKKEKSVDLEVGNQEPGCQVTSENLVSTAQATVTKALKGLCHAKDMYDRFEEMENSIMKELGNLKKMIQTLEAKLGDHGEVVMYGQKQLNAAIVKECSTNEFIGNGAQPLYPDINGKNYKPSTDFSKPKIDDLSDEEVSSPRDAEIFRFNSSIHMESGTNGSPKKVFTYYWKIKDMTYMLTGWNPRKSFRSQSFYIFPSGYRMYMRVFPRQNEDNFYVRVGLTKGEFDDTLNWPFPLKHKIHILDQTKEGRLFEDIASRIWDPTQLCSDFNWQKPIKGDNHECVEIGVPHDVLQQREYIRRDTLIIKLTVYLKA